MHQPYSKLALKLCIHIADAVLDNSQDGEEGPFTLHYNDYKDGSSKVGKPEKLEVDVVIGADGANSRVAKEIDAGDYDYAIAFQACSLSVPLATARSKTEARSRVLIKRLPGKHWARACMACENCKLAQVKTAQHMETPGHVKPVCGCLRRIRLDLSKPWWCRKGFVSRTTRWTITRTWLRCMSAMMSLQTSTAGCSPSTTMSQWVSHDCFLRHHLI